MRVPIELTVELGSPLFVKRCVGLRPDTFSASVDDAGGVRVFDEIDVAEFAALDSRIFRSDLSESRAWVGPQFGARGFRHWVAEFDGSPVAIATTARSDGEAGPAAYLYGLGALPGSAREAVANLIAVALRDAFDAGAALVHANPHGDASMKQLAAFGATEVPGFLIRVVVDA